MARSSEMDTNPHGIGAMRGIQNGESRFLGLTKGDKDDPLTKTWGPGMQLGIDWWALAVTIHYLIFGKTPCFYLDIHPNDLNDYGEAGGWPNPMPSRDWTIKPSQEENYKDYKIHLTTIQTNFPSLYSLFERTFNQGRRTIQSRAQPRDWPIQLFHYRRSCLTRPTLQFNPGRLLLAIPTPNPPYKENYVRLGKELTHVQIKYLIDASSEAPAERISLFDIEKPLTDKSEVHEETAEPPGLGNEVAIQTLSGARKDGKTPGAFRNLPVPKSGYYCLVVDSDAGKIYKEVGPYRQMPEPCEPDFDVPNLRNVIPTVHVAMDRKIVPVPRFSEEIPRCDSILRFPATIPRAIFPEYPSVPSEEIPRLNIAVGKAYETLPRPDITNRNLPGMTEVERVRQIPLPVVRDIMAKLLTEWEQRYRPSQENMAEIK